LGLGLSDDERRSCVIRGGLGLEGGPAANPWHAPVVRVSICVLVSTRLRDRMSGPAAVLLSLPTAHSGEYPR
jgi:hypothetical protein